MTRQELCKVRDTLFADILASTRGALLISEWSMDDRLVLTMKNLQYQAVVCQLRELKDDEAFSAAVCALDECRGRIWDILHRDGMQDPLGQKALEHITHALTMLGV